MDALLEMRKPDELLLETDGDIFLLKREGLIRYSKPEGKPQIVKVKSLTLNVDRYDAKMEMLEEEIITFAKMMRLILFETEDG